VKRWALLTIALYLVCLLVLGIAIPTGVDGAVTTLEGLSERGFPDSIPGAVEMLTHWPTWLVVAFFVLSQAALLVVPVKAAAQRPVKRRHVLVTIFTSAFLAALLVAMLAFMIVIGFLGEGYATFWAWSLLGLFCAMWVAWFFLFRWLCLWTDDPKDWVSKIMFYLYMGSILELLVAVSTHIIVRKRGDCCAPAVTVFGMACGIAVALLTFGPGVFYLFAARKKRITAATSATATAR
jgi:hypothetical protein